MGNQSGLVNESIEAARCRLYIYIVPLEQHFRSKFGRRNHLLCIQPHRLLSQCSDLDLRPQPAQLREAERTNQSQPCSAQLHPAPVFSSAPANRTMLRGHHLSSSSQDNCPAASLSKSVPAARLVVLLRFSGQIYLLNFWSGSAWTPRFIANSPDGWPSAPRPKREGLRTGGHRSFWCIMSHNNVGL